MAVVAGEITVAQGDAGEVVAVQEEYVVKEGERAGQARVERHERVLVAVPDGEGNVAVAEGVRVQAVEIEQVPPASRPARAPPFRPAQPAPPHQQQPPRRPQPRRTPAPRRTTQADDRTPLIAGNNRRQKRFQVHLPGCILCSLLYIVCGILLIGVSFGFVWPCPPFRFAAVSIAAFGVIAMLVGCTCCCYVFRVRGTKAVLLCLLVGALFLLALAAALVEISEALIKKRNFFIHSKNMTECNRYDLNAVIPASLVVVTYTLLGLLFFYFIGTIFNALTGRKESPALYK